MSTFAKGKYAVDLSWPPALVFGIYAVASQLLDNRYKFFSATTVAVVIAIAVLLVGYIFIAENRFHADRAYVATGLCVLYVTVLDVYGLSHLVRLLLEGGQGVYGAPLLASSVFFWGSNVLAFGLWYWLIDRGGPHMRARTVGGRVEFLFPEMTASEIADDKWRPGLVEYMYLSFTDATAFSPTDTLPLSSRARVLMTLESTLSLVTIAFVTARAVNILS